MSRVEFNPLQPGAIVHGRYVVEKTLGIGSMAIVYKCRDTRIRKREIALKVLFPGMKDEVRARFIKEIMYTYEIVHANVVRTYDLIEEPDFLAITMEYVSGGSLANIIYNQNGLSINASVDILTQLARGVHAIHEAGIVHRDLKPDNVLMARDGQAKIADFSVAWGNNATKLTRHGGVIGSFSYVSPEYMDNGQLDHRADIYALGVIGYELLTRRLPHQGDMVSQLVSRARNEVAPPSAILDGCPQVISDIVMKALEPDPNQRYQNVSEMYQDLERFKSENHTGQEVSSEIADIIESCWPKSTGSLRPTVFVRPFYRRPVVHLASVLILGIAAALGIPALSSPPVNAMQRESTPKATERKPAATANSTSSGPLSNPDGLPETLSFSDVGSTPSNTSPLNIFDLKVKSEQQPPPVQVAMKAAEPPAALKLMEPKPPLPPVNTAPPAPVEPTEAIKVEPPPSEPHTETARLRPSESDGGVQYASMEYQVKAALLYKFLFAVSWPEDLPKSSAAVKSICVIGQDQFGGAIEQILAKARVSDKVTVKRFPAGTSSGAVTECHVAYVSGEQFKNTNEMVEALQDAHVLTVTERLSAGMIHLYIHRGQVRFDVDSKIARDAGIQVPHALARLSADS